MISSAKNKAQTSASVSGGAIGGITVALIVALVAVLFFFWRRHQKRSQDAFQKVDSLNKNLFMRRSVRLSQATRQALSPVSGGFSSDTDSPQTADFPSPDIQGQERHYATLHAPLRPPRAPGMFSSRRATQLSTQQVPRAPSLLSRATSFMTTGGFSTFSDVPVIVNTGKQTMQKVHLDTAPVTFVQPVRSPKDLIAFEDNVQTTSNPFADPVSRATTPNEVSLFLPGSPRSSLASSQFVPGYRQSTDLPEDGRPQSSLTTASLPFAQPLHPLRGESLAATSNPSRRPSSQQSRMVYSPMPPEELDGLIPSRAPSQAPSEPAEAGHRDSFNTFKDYPIL